MKNNIKKIAIIALCVSILIQILLVANFDGEQVSDQAAYLSVAKQQVASHSLYPSEVDVYSAYIFAPGYVNYLSLILSIFGSVKCILFINIILLGIINFEIFSLTKKYFNENSAYIYLILSSCYITNYGVVMYTATELLFTSLVFGALLLFVKDRTKYCVYAGILLGLSNWVRPFLPVYLLVFALIAIFILSNKIVKFSVFFVSLFSTIVAIGTFTYFSCGYFLYQSSTGGLNLLMGANDYADGSYNPQIFKRGYPGYYQSKDGSKILFNERDSFYKNLAWTWIKENPAQYGMLFPKKFFYMYVHDFHSLAPLSGDMNNDAGSKKNIVAVINSFPNLSSFQWIMILNQLYYGFILLLAAIGASIIIKRRNVVGILLLLICVLGTAMTLLTVGGSRYHFSYMYIFILFASFAATQLRSRFLLRKKSNVQVV